MLTRRSSLFGGLALLTGLAAPVRGQISAAPLRISSLRFGSLSWLLDTIRDRRIDAKLALKLDIVEAATSQAGPIALMAGAADVIVSDWTWALRQRSAGEDVLFKPFSSALGAVMVPNGSLVRSLADLKGKRLGVAGSAIDKSWLLLRAYGQKTIGKDIAEIASPVFGAAPLLTEEIRNGRLDAVLNFWTFAARLQGHGFERLLNMADVLKGLGIEPTPPLVGFVFRERTLAAKRPAFEAFFDAVAQGNTVLAQSDAAWERLRPLVKPANDPELAAIRSFYRAGIPGPWGQAETRSAEKLFALLVELGDKELVGPGTRFDARLFHGA